MATENLQINHPVATGAALDSGAHQGLFGYDTTTGRCRFQFGALAANAKSLANFGDAPTAHKASHEYGGADALVGQSIAGLRTSDSPNFTSIVASSVTRISAAGAAALTGLTSSGGATITGGKTALAAGTTSYATANIPSGTAPTTPVDGDIWSDGTGVWLRGLRFVPNGLESRTSVPYGTSGLGAPVGPMFDESQFAVDQDNIFRIYMQLEKQTGTTGRGKIVIGYRGPSNTAVFQDAIVFDKNLTSFVTPTKSTGTIAAWTSKTAAYTATSSDKYIGVSGASAFQITLPATAVIGTEYVIKRTDANTATITISAGGTTTIDAGTTTTLTTAYQVVRLVARATNAYSIV